MKQYKTLFFDLDDTLLDFGATEEVALQKLFDQQNITLTPEIKKHYKQLNDRLWNAFEEGKMDRDVVVNTRFSILFEEYGLRVDGVELEKQYRSYLNEGHHIMEGAVEIIQLLSRCFDLYVVTNGASVTQKKRLQDSGLAPYFQQVFISEEVNFQKPMKEFFQYVFQRIDYFELNEALIIGDSLTSDITGGHNVGMDTCWFNPKTKENHTEIIPTYEIQKLKELAQILHVPN